MSEAVVRRRECVEEAMNGNLKKEQKLKRIKEKQGKKGKGGNRERQLGNRKLT